MRQFSCLLLSLAMFGVVQLPILGQTKKDEPKAKKEEPRNTPKTLIPAAPSFKHLDGQMLVFVANGAGGSTMASDNLMSVNEASHLGLRIQMVPWCRHDSVYKDLVDTKAQLNAAAKIAMSVQTIRKDAPNAQIFFMGQSAGARVVLAAAEMLPPKSIERIFLIAPAVSSTYDLTGALKTARYGIDNFWSSDDGVLAAAVDHLSTADGLKAPAAGLVGFRVCSNDKKDIEAYRNVRQYAWNIDLCGSGGHFAWARQHNMKKVIAPLFFTQPILFPEVIEKKEPPTKK